MDPLEFKQRLEEIAIIQEIKPVGINNCKKRFELVIEIDQDGNETEVEVPIPIENQTLGIEIIKLKPITKLCEMGCGKVIPNQKLEKRMSVYPVPHWKTKCCNCGKYLAPNGIDLLEDSHRAQAAFLWHLRDKK